MYLHEYQAKSILSEYGIPVMAHTVVSSYEELQNYVNAHCPDEAVLKIQVHSGGRGKAGGIVYAKSKDEILEYGKKLIGMKIITAQTGPEGIVAEKVLIDTPVDFAKEYYLAITLDRKRASAMLIASCEGGVEIEQVAKHTPEKILTEHIDSRITESQLHKIENFLHKDCKAIVTALVKAFFELDACLIEINPLVLTKEQKLIALDAKMQIDDNALFRQARLKEMFDPSQISHEERVAQEHDLAYVAMPGNIGCVVNGAGLAMATMDLIGFWGGHVANFLDVGGGASMEKVMEGFKILFNDPKVMAIFVNIFGGIMNCEIIAQALIAVPNDKKVPVVVRMEGTNVQGAKKMLKEANIFTIDSLDEAAKRVVELVDGNIGQ